MGRCAEIDDFRKFTGPAERQKAINSFRGILEGISIDSVVDEQEQLELRNWYELYRHLIDRHPFNEILPAIDVALCDNVLTAEEVQDLLWLCDQVSSGSYYDLVTSSIQTLHGVIHGVLANSALTDIEIQQLHTWLEDHSILRGTYPFDEIYSLVSSFLEDGIITEEERGFLIAFFSEFIDARESYNLRQPELDKLKTQYSISGICSRDPDMTISHRTFCFTGASSRATRNEIAEIIISRGGTFSNTVTKKTDYLIVGSEGNPCWAFSCYGRKVEKAVAARKAGGHIQIVNELDFWNALAVSE